jgi:integrase
MARAINRLTDRKVQSIKEPGRHPDGGGLYLRITPKGARSWVFMSAAGGAGRLEIGLGAASAIGLAAARRKAEALREAVANGADPRETHAKMQEAERPQKDIEVPTFKDFAEEYIRNQESAWKGGATARMWRQTIRDFAGPVLLMGVDAVETKDIISVLRPIWDQKKATADKLRSRLEKIFGAAKAAGYRPTDSINPAAWDGHLQHFLSDKSGNVTHRSAIPWKEMPEFWATLCARRRTATTEALKLVILCASRAGEVRGARVSEFDLENALWIIPAERMKTGIEHVVPLSTAALSIVREMMAHKGPDAYVFPGQSISSPLSPTAIWSYLRLAMGRAETVHGFRSSFRDWAGDATHYPREVAEMALAHTVGGVEGAYRRGRAVEKRRPLMADWAAFLEGAT